jgi:hypothetical protein
MNGARATPALALKEPVFNLKGRASNVAVSLVVGETK